jgi:hypothetical protein
MVAARTSETLENFYRTTWRYNPEDSRLSTQSFFVMFMNIVQLAKGVQRTALARQSSGNVKFPLCLSTTT